MTDSRPSPFRYFGDPVCLTAMALYAANRWLLKPWDLSGDFGRCYLNDVLCLPMLLPMILYAQRLFRIRRTDAPPRPWEVVQHWAVFSVVFELVLPLCPQWFRSTADPYDVVAYAVGGLAALLVWSRSGTVVRVDGEFYDGRGVRRRSEVDAAAI